MSETNPNSLISSTETKAKSSNAQGDKTKSATKQKKRHWPFVQVVLMLTIIIGFIGLAFFYFEQQKALQVLFDQHNMVAEESARHIEERKILQQELNNLAEELGLTRDEISEQQSENDLVIGNLQRELISARLSMSDNGRTGSQPWNLAEAESLLRLAQQRLITSQDVRSALALFIAADDILKQINDPAIFSIRSVLATDMAELRAVNEIDVEGIYLELSALANSVEMMRVKNNQGRQLNTTENETAETHSMSILDSMVATFERYIVVSRSDQVIQPLLSKEQQYYLKQTIVLQLEQAKLSLIQGRENIYRSSLQSASDYIEMYLESDVVQQKQSVLNSMQRLFNISINPQIPSASNSLIALQRILPLSEQVEDNE